jgi:predicted nucleic-acid-binding Zn-ribbon protein
MTPAPCPKCKHPKIIQRAAVRVPAPSEGSGAVRLHTYDRPGATLFKGGHQSDITAHICARCGFTELYADDPEALIVATSFSQNDDDDGDA